MKRKAQIEQAGLLIGLFISVIVAAAILPTLADQVENANTDEVFLNDQNFSVQNNTITNILLNNTPVSSAMTIDNATGSRITEQTEAPGWQLADAATGNVSYNLTGIDVGDDKPNSWVLINYSYTGSSNLSATDRTLLGLWPTFVIIGILMIILAGIGFRG